MARTKGSLPCCREEWRAIRDSGATRETRSRASAMDTSSRDAVAETKILPLVRSNRGSDHVGGEQTPEPDIRLGMSFFLLSIETSPLWRSPESRHISLPSLKSYAEAFQKDV